MRNREEPSRTDRILDLLLDALAERQMARQGHRSWEPEPEPAHQAPEIEIASPSVDRDRLEVDATEPESEPAVEPKARDVQVSDPAEPVPPAVHPAAGQMTRVLPRLVIGLLALVVMVNIPLSRQGPSLARAMPDSAALIIRDGLLVKGEESEEIYVLQDNQLRWISSLDAFDRLGYRWRDVHTVEESFLDKFEEGRPLHVLLKCSASPHIYRIEREQKRWIKDIPAFQAEGHVWEDVRIVSCDYLRLIPDGLSIPPDAGPPPQP
jgi:hypothetical protein